MRVVLDTNVLVSGTYWQGDSFKIIQMVENCELELVISEEIIKEYARVVASEEIIEKTDPNNRLLLFAATQKIIQNSTFVEPKTKLKVVEDPEDDKIIEAAVTGSAEFIITNDRHLLKIRRYENTEILTPGEFLLRKEAEE